MAKTTTKSRKDPNGGLTAEGRKHFKESEGANLRPGVKSVRTPEDMKRKGSFLRRHYGKKATSTLQDKNGEPTRFAKQAHAWGEKVPKTQADVKRLAEKGTELLDRYHRAMEKADAKSKKTSSKRSTTAKRKAAGTKKSTTRKRNTTKAKSRR